MPRIENNLTNVNYTWRGSSPTWIVIHNSYNQTSNPPIAYNNTQYFKNEYRGASANYFIDDGDTIYCCVEPTNTAWHCGEADSRNGCHNYNSIGIEVCEPANGKFTDKEIANLSWLVQKLMGDYSIPASRICRHYDVTGKNCPWYYTDDARWNELKAQIIGDDDNMTDAQMKQLAKYIAQAQAEYGYGDDNKGIWGEHGKNTGKASRNNYNVSRWIYDLLNEIVKKLDKIITKLGA